MNWNKERKDSIFEAVSKAPEMEFKLNLPCLVQQRTRRIQASTVQESYSHLINADKVLQRAPSNVRCLGEKMQIALSFHLICDAVLATTKFPITDIWQVGFASVDINFFSVVDLCP